MNGEKVSEAMNGKRPVTLGEVARALEAKLTGEQQSEVTDGTHDSRRAGDGSLFVAIRGGTLDGHRFVGQVMGQGAAGVISEQTFPRGVFWGGGGGWKTQQHAWCG